VTAWNIADVYEAIAEAVPDRPCQVQGERVVSWADFDRRANALAADLVAAGLSRQAKVAAYLYNGPEYLEAYVGAFKAGMAPVNTNYRYGPEEIRYLFDNADAEAVVFHASFAEVLEKLRGDLPRVRRWYAVADGSPEPDWAVPYEEVVAAGADRVVHPWGRSPDDVLLLYTGGTTGMPKGVMWRQDDLFNVLGASGHPMLGIPPAEDVDEVVRRAATSAGPVVLPACPLMHGTGQFSAILVMNMGGTVVCLESRRFDVEEVWRTVERRRVNSIIIVGDAFGRPMLAHLDEHPGRYDLSSLMSMTSSGVMWSQEVKTGLLRHVPQAVLLDSFGSSEAVGLGTSVSAAGQAERTARFMLGERVKVFTADDREVGPGSGEQGQVAITGYIPVGYYKDAAKTAATFRTIGGVRWSIPGDWAQVEEDGTITLLGRGSVCINTGGEKVFPEEVEEALKRHPSVRDAVVVGVPDDRFGEVIAALVEPQDGAEVDGDDLIGHVKDQLAGYKAPRVVLTVPSIGRSPAGKVDYKALKALARERTGR
jgi:3-oxocholest-4-en-26-oate---CoA ligase